MKFIIIIEFIINLILFFSKLKYNFSVDSDNIYLDNSSEKFEGIDVNILFPIQEKLKQIVELSFGAQTFLNGLIRNFKPKKIVELGVSAGGSSALILNAIKDLPYSRLYSIDRYNEWYKNKSKKVGWLVKERFPELMNKWKLYTGKNPAEYLEEVGNKIDFAFIDTVHFTPGEMLNWLEILPFLKEEAIIVFHDPFLMFYGNFEKRKRKNYSNNQLLCYIRGQLILPSYGEKIFNRNIGALKLEKNQKKYFKLYFLALGNQWDYLPEERDLIIMREYFLKYYGKQFVEIYDDAVGKNKRRFQFQKK